MSSLTITQVLPAPNSVTVEETGSSTSVVVQQSFNNTTVVVNPLNVTNYYGGGGEVSAALTGVPTLSTDLGTFAPGTVISNNTTIYGALNELDTYVTNQNTTIGNIQSDVAGATTDISNNAANISSNTSAIATNTGNISANTGDIGILQGGLAQEITDRQAGDTSLQLQIDANNLSISNNDIDIATNASNISTNTSAISNLITGDLTQSLDPTELNLFFTDPGTYATGTTIETILRDVLIHYQIPSITGFVANGIPTVSIEHGTTDTITTASWSVVNPSSINTGVTGSLTYYDPVGTSGESWLNVAYNASPYTLNKSVTFLVTALTAGAANTPLAQTNTYYLRLSGLQDTQGTGLPSSTDFFTVNYKTFVLTSPTQINAGAVTSSTGNQLLADCAAGTNGSTEEHVGLHPNSQRQTTLTYPDTVNYWYLCMPQCHWEYANKITTDQGFAGFDITATVVNCGAFVYTNSQGVDVNMQLLRGSSIGQISSGKYIKVEYDSGSALNSAPPPTGGQPGPSQDLLLDTYSGAAAAYSVRLLDKDYTGRCMRIRRASDDAETDIGFDSNGDLDTAAIAAHCTTSNGFVTVWADQSGNGNDATQSTDSSQPQIYNGTSVITENGKPTCFFSGAKLGISVSLTTVDFSLFATYRKTTTSGQAGVFGLGPDSTTYDDIELNQYGSLLAVFYGTASGYSSVQYTTSETNQRLVTFLTATNDVKLFENSTQRDSNTNITSKSTTTAIIRPRTSADINIQEIVVYNSNQSSNRTGIETNINSEYLIYQPTDAPTSGLLATYTGAAAAYSVRQLSDKAIICMTVRRDSDDEEKRFGFDSNGDLDTAGIASFCGSGNGYVTRWWDQSTNGNHADQLTNASQPKIYDGTTQAVITENGKPAIFADFNDFLNTSISLTQPFTYFTVDSPDFADWTSLLRDSNGYGHLQKRNTNLMRISSTTILERSGAITLAQHAFYALFNGTNSTIGVDGDTTNGDAGTNGPSNLVVGWTFTSRYYRQEVIIYNNDQSTNRTGIESDVNTYFSIY